MWADMVDGYQQSALSSRLGIPMIYGTDAVHGHNNVFGSTVFPHNIGLGATRYKELEFGPFLVGCVWMYSKLHFWNHQSRYLKLRQILIWFWAMERHPTPNRINSLSALISNFWWILLLSFVCDRDADMVLRIGKATALEIRGSGIPYTFAPCLAVSF